MDWRGRSRVGANPKRIPKLLVSTLDVLTVMAFASVLPSGGYTVLLEREDNVASLRALADTARAGGGRLAVIEGTAGIGKTRLLGEVRAIADSAGMRVLAARGGELESEFAYGIVRQLFEPLMASVSPDVREELLSGPAALVEPRSRPIRSWIPTTRPERVPVPSR